MLPEYQLKTADLYNIPIGNVKKLVTNFFDKEKYVTLGLRLKLKNTSRIRIQSITMVKTIYLIQHTKRIESDKNNDKHVKALYKLMNNAIYGKTMENLGNRFDVKLVNNEKEYLKCTSNSSYISHKLLDNNLVPIRKSKPQL